LFNANELELDVGQLVDQDVGVWNVLVTMQATLGLLKALIDFIDKIWKASNTLWFYNHGPCETRW
jgi:hypothetical protein